MQTAKPLSALLAQAKINEVEAASQSGFQAGWRPLAGYVCVAGLAHDFLVRPLLPCLLIVAGAADVPPLPSLDEVLFELVFGMLGLGALRTADRWKRVSALAPK
ncbi:3TM-type holin [Azotobacter sp. CWF10]